MIKTGNYTGLPKSRSVTLAGWLLLGLGVLLIVAPVAVLVGNGESRTAIASAMPGLLIVASGLGMTRRWRGWRYYSGVMALFLVYVGLGSSLVGIRDLLIEAFLPREARFFATGGAAAVFVVAVAMAILGLGVFIIQANREEPFSPGEKSAEPTIIGGLFLLIGVGCWVGVAAAITRGDSSAIVGYAIAVSILTTIGLFIILRLRGWRSVAAILGVIAIIVGVLAIIVGTAVFVFSHWHTRADLNTAMGGVLLLLFGRHILAARHQDKDTSAFSGTQGSRDEANMQPRAP
jgi:hypothetical protein